MTGRAVALLSLAAFAGTAGLRATDPLLALIAHEFGVTPGAASSVITGFSVAYGLFQIVHGPLGDRVGKYRTVSAATALSAVGAFACALADSLEGLVVARFVSGAMVGALVPLSIAWIGDVVPYERRQPVLARFLIGQMLGVAFGVAAGGLVGERFGWRAIFVLLGALYLAVALMLFLELRANPLARRRGEAGVSLLQAFRRMAGLLAGPWVRAILATVFVEGALLYGALSFVAWDLQARFGLRPGASGAMVMAFSAGGLLYAGSAGRIVARLGERGLALSGGLALAAGFVGLLVAPAAAFYIPCLFATGAGLYMLHNTLQVNATQMAPESRGAALALFAFCLFNGQSFGVWLAGRAVDAWGTKPLFAAAAAGLLLVAIDFRRRLARRAAPR